MTVDALRAEGLAKVYGEGDAQVRALDDATVALAPGEVTLVMGPSGSGKTTLLFLLGGLLRPTAGHVWVDGEDLAALPERKLPRVRLRNFGFVFQDFNLLANLTARENVQVPMELAGAREPAPGRPRGRTHREPGQQAREGGRPAPPPRRGPDEGRRAHGQPRRPDRGRRGPAPPHGGRPPARDGMTPWAVRGAREPRYADPGSPDAPP